MPPSIPFATAPTNPRVPVTVVYSLEEFTRIDWEPVRNQVRTNVEVRRLAERPRIAPRNELKHIPLAMAPVWPPPATGELLFQEGEREGKPLAQFPLKGVETLTASEIFAKMKPVDIGQETLKNKAEQQDHAVRGLPKLQAEDFGVKVVTNPIMRDEVKFLLREIQGLDIMKFGSFSVHLKNAQEHSRMKRAETSASATAGLLLQPENNSTRIKRAQPSVSTVEFAAPSLLLSDKKPYPDISLSACAWNPSYGLSGMRRRMLAPLDREGNRPGSSLSGDPSTDYHLPPELQQRLSQRRIGGRFEAPLPTNVRYSDVSDTTTSATQSNMADTFRDSLLAPSRAASIRTYLTKRQEKILQHDEENEGSETVARRLARMSQQPAWVQGFWDICPAALRDHNGGYKLPDAYDAHEHGVFIPWETEDELDRAAERKNIAQLCREVYSALEMLEETVRQNTELPKAPLATQTTPTVAPAATVRSHGAVMEEIAVAPVSARRHSGLHHTPRIPTVEARCTDDYKDADTHRECDSPNGVHHPRTPSATPSARTISEKLRHGFRRTSSYSDFDSRLQDAPTFKTPTSHAPGHSGSTIFDISPPSPMPAFPRPALRVPLFEGFQARTQAFNSHEASYELFLDHRDATDRPRQGNRRSTVESSRCYQSDRDEPYKRVVSPVMATYQTTPSVEEKRMRRMGWDGKEATGWLWEVGLRRSGAKRKSKGGDVE